MARVQKPKIYRGYYYEEAPRIKANGLQIATVSDIARLEHAGLINPLDSYTTSTGIAYAGDLFDGFKVIPSSQSLRDITIEAQLYDGGQRLTWEEYEEIPYPELSREDLIGKLSFEEAQKYNGLLGLFEDDEDLLNLCKKNESRRVRIGFKGKAIIEFHIRNPQEVPNLRPVTFTTSSNQTISTFSNKYGPEDDVLLVVV